MNQRMLNRLHGLEQSHARSIAIAKAEDAEAGLERWLAKSGLFLELVGVEQGPNESMRSTIARALGISTDELDRRLEIEDPIHEPLMQAIQREKAAGRWISDPQV
jgi:hypothetical protein